MATDALKIITVRMSPALHAKVKESAALNAASMNQVCIDAIASYVEEESTEQDGQSTGNAG